MKKILGEEDRLINVEGCHRCKKLIGDLREQKKTRNIDGYEQCGFCGADIDLFWFNVDQMKFQDSRPASDQRASHLAKLISGDDFKLKETSKKTFGEEADKFLKDLYDKHGTVFTQHKVELLKTILGGTFNFYAMGYPVTDEMMLGALEYDYLEKMNKIRLTYV